MKKCILITIFILINIVSFSQNKRLCFTNSGLKYETNITINIYKNNNVIGVIKSGIIGDVEIEEKKFTGVKIGNKIKVKFIGTPPVIGDASKWTKNNWTLKTENKTEILSIIFYAKNYETMKWSNTIYEFEKCN